MKFIILNLTVDCEPFREFDRIKRTYYRDKNVDFKFLYNGEEGCNFTPDKEDVMYDIGLSDKYQHSLDTIPFYNNAGIPMMLFKFLEEIKKPEYDEYDYIVRTNSSTFINVDKLKNVLETAKIPSNSYIGWPNDNMPGISYMSGIMIVIPQQLRRIINATDVSSVAFHCDDVAIGIIAEQMCSAIPYNLDRSLICSFVESENKVTEELIKNNLAIRIRRADLVRNNEVDKKVWQKIESFL